MRTAFGASFLGAAGYLDTATMGVPPTFAADRMREAVDRWQQGAWRPQDFVAPSEEANRAFAQLIGCGERGITQGSSVSALMAVIAASLPDAASVLVCRGEYSSLTFPFVAQGYRGVTVTEVGLGELAERAGQFDVVAVSAIQSADGRVADLTALRAAAAATGTRVIVDVTQAAGWAVLDLDWADAVVGAAYKWLLGWRGQAWMWTSDTFRSGLIPVLANWSAGEERWASNYGSVMRLAENGRGLDSSPVWFSQLAAAVVLPWLASLDRAAVHSHCVGLANAVRGAAGLAPADSPIVTLPGAVIGPALQSGGLRPALRGGGARIGFHLYNTQEDADAVIDALRLA